MSKSYGFIEITGVVAAIDALDIMCKTADVELASWERKLGGRLVTIIVEGDVSAVTEAVNAAATGAIKKPVSYAVVRRTSTCTWTGTLKGRNPSPGRREPTALPGPSSEPRQAP